MSGLIYHVTAEDFQKDRAAFLEKLEEAMTQHISAMDQRIEKRLESFEKEMRNGFKELKSELRSELKSEIRNLRFQLSNEYVFFHHSSYFLFV